MWVRGNDGVIMGVHSHNGLGIGPKVVPETLHHLKLEIHHHIQYGLKKMEKKSCKSHYTSVEAADNIGGVLYTHNQAMYIDTHWKTNLDNYAMLNNGMILCK